MPIVLQCPCGKRTGVSNALAGKTVRCPVCGEELFADPAMAITPAPPPRKARETVHISGGIITLILLFVIGGGAAWIIDAGPMRVSKEWDAMGPKAEGEVEDVIVFALRAYKSQDEPIDPAKGHYQPAVDGGVSFLVPKMVMRLPEKLRFAGMTQEGRFTGNYDTRTGDIEAVIAYGGRTVAGLLVTDRAEGTIHITGRDTGGSPQAELGGQPLSILYTTHATR